MLSSLAFLSVALPAALAFPQPSGRRDETGHPSQGIQWGPCEKDIQELSTDPKLICGNVTVPKDYTQPKGETIEIELVKSPAPNKGTKKSILMNFGGPGGSGRLEMPPVASLLRAIVGDNFHIIGFDSRGIGKTLPFSCFADGAESALGTAWQYEAGNSSDVAKGRLWATSKAISNLCVKNSDKDIRDIIGTSFTARDLIEIAEALQEDGMLRYWGLSYGSALGQTVASMFPEKVDRVILDANLDPHEWWHGHDVNTYAGTDATFSALVAACASVGPECPLAADGSTASQIEAKIYKLMEDLKQNPVVHKDFILDYSIFRGELLIALYGTGSWQAFTYFIDGILKGNVSVIDTLPPIQSSSQAGERRFGIACGDKPTRGRQAAEKAIEQVIKLSKVAGDTAVQVMYQCAQWPFSAKERYTGPLSGVKTANPILLLQNRYDPVCSMGGARNMTAVFEHAVLVEQNGFGHSSLAQPSLCTRNIIRKYLNQGVLPEVGKVCEVDVPTWTNKTWVDVYT